MIKEKIIKEFNEKFEIELNKIIKDIPNIFLGNIDKYKEAFYKRLDELTDDELENGFKFERDNRTFAEWLINIIIKGWLIEDHFYDFLNNKDIKITKNGEDKERKFGISSTDQDFIINGEKVEFQILTNHTLYLKTYKIDKLIKDKAKMVIFDIKNNKLYGIGVKIAEEIKNKNNTVEFYKGKTLYKVKLNEIHLFKNI